MSFENRYLMHSKVIGLFYADAERRKLEIATDDPFADEKREKINVEFTNNVREFTRYFFGKKNVIEGRRE